MSEMRLDPVVVGEVIAAYRLRKGVTQEVLSGLADIGRTHLSAIERGGRKPMSPEEKAAAAKGYPAQGQQQNTVQSNARGRQPIYLRLPPSCTINHDI